MRLVLADSHRLLIESLAMALTRRGFEIAAVATSPREVFAKIAQHEPDVCLLCARFPSCSGLDVLRVIRKRYPAVGVIMLSDRSDQELTRAAVEYGAAAVISTDCHISDIERAVARVGGREQDFDGALLSMVGRDLRLSRAGNGRGQVTLTAREKEVLMHMMNGASTQQIGRSLAISEATVRAHVRNLLTKLGVHSRLEATAMAARTGVLGDHRHGVSTRRATHGR
jgi:two-component system nitrate/nitrite response regulator NarL